MQQQVAIPVCAVPTRVWRSRYAVELTDTRNCDFSLPTFRRAIDSAAAFGTPWKLRTTFESLIRIVEAEAPLPPKAFIFHTGRCGSTLLTNLLGAHPDLRMVKEPAVIGQFLIDGPPFRAASREGATLRALITGLGRGLRNGHGPVIKFPSWMVAEADVLLDLFPDVPVVFVWRQAAPVVASSVDGEPLWRYMRSVREMRDRWFRDPGAAAGHTWPPEPIRTDPSRAAFYAEAWRAAAAFGLELVGSHGERTHVVGYDQLSAHPVETAMRIAEAIGIGCPPAVIESMTAGARIYSKDHTGRVDFDPARDHRRAPLTGDDVRVTTEITGRVEALLLAAAYRAGQEQC